VLIETLKRRGDVLEDVVELAVEVSELVLLFDLEDEVVAEREELWEVQVE
jgi:hypothetical protein